MNSLQGIPDKVEGPRTRVDMGPTEPENPIDRTLSTTHEEVAAAIAAAEASSDPRGHRETPVGTSPVETPPADAPPATDDGPGEPTAR